MYSHWIAAAAAEYNRVHPIPIETLRTHSRGFGNAATRRKDKGFDIDLKLGICPAPSVQRVARTDIVRRSNIIVDANLRCCNSLSRSNGVEHQNLLDLAVSAHAVERKGQSLQLVGTDELEDFPTERR